MLFFHCYCYLLFTVRTSSLELFVHLLCEINHHISLFVRQKRRDVQQTVRTVILMSMEIPGAITTAATLIMGLLQEGNVCLAHQSASSVRGTASTIWYAMTVWIGITLSCLPIHAWVSMHQRSSARFTYMHMNRIMRPHRFYHIIHM